MIHRISAMKLWKKALILMGALVVICAVIWGAVRIISGNSDVARFRMAVSAPTPAEFTDDVTTTLSPNNMPEVNNNREIDGPGELIVSFEQIGGQYAPPIKMDINDADIERYVQITPAVSGRWRRYGPTTLAFMPGHNWPANTKFNVGINPAIINPDVRVSSRRASFTTAPINATVDSFNTYLAGDQTITAIAVISFNYPIDIKNFRDRVTMRVDGDKVGVNIRFDKFHRTVLIQSDPIEITKNARDVRLKLNRISAASATDTTQKISATTTVPAADNVFKISSVTTTIADDAAGAPQQLLLINTTAAVAQKIDWNRYVKLYLLPTHRDGDESDDDAPHKWADDEITPDVLRTATQIKIKPVKFESPMGVYQYAISYDVNDGADRFIYAEIKSGIPGEYGFSLKNPVTRVLSVPYPEQSVKIAGSGALLAMGGERKLGLVARGGAAAAYVNLAKVKSSEINHLISQTYNVFSPSIEFKSWSFDAYDMASVFKKRIGFSDTSLKSVNYASVDLGEYLDRTNRDKTGIFIVRVGATQSDADYSDGRVILLTDMGIIRKKNLDGSSTVFVSEISTGAPATDVQISVLGRNGNAVWAGQTDDGGRADIPALPWREYNHEKLPVAIVARRDDDVSFIPYDNAYDRHVEYSKFDVDGVYASNATSMNAFLFSDRGIYRPGESVIIGGIVKNRSFKPLIGVPVRLEIRDPRGRLVFEKMFSLTADGMFDVTYTPTSGAPTGTYMAQLFSLTAKNKSQDILGNTDFRIEEFMPDNLKISATIADADATGWLKPEKIDATISLRTMFGTAAANRRIKIRTILQPVKFDFSAYPEYKFGDNFIGGTGLANRITSNGNSDEIDDIRTDENGMANVTLNLDNRVDADATYQLTMIANGFDDGDGRGVQTVVTTRVSNAEYLVGWHADSDLSYINRGAARTVRFIAIDATGAPTSTGDVTVRLVHREKLTSLIKDYNDYYKYQTITRDKIITDRTATIDINGTDINLDTLSPGTYFLQVLGADNNILANVEYFVAGDKNVQLQSDTNAELQIKLDAAEYAPGNEIRVSITAPYAGSGLITIERDKVYAYKWFNAPTTTSVQTITVPDGFEGTGYINVSFVRDINSRDIFTTPYTYAVAPFISDTARRTIGVKLTTPDVIKDKKLTVKYETNANARIMIFAVNDAILRVARYAVPRPIAYFFKKAALQVETYQILSLILPEYNILREFAKTGGGDFDGGTENGAVANPFARRVDDAVAFYSNIIDVRANRPGEITFDIPEYFNGTMRIFAVAANDSGAGSADTTTIVQSPVIVSTSAPTAVAPNDEFYVNAIVTNMTGASDSNEFNVSAATSGPIEITSPNTTTMQIANGTDDAWTVRTTAGRGPGAAEINIAASNGTESATGHATISVRPTSIRKTSIASGTLNSRKDTLRLAVPEIYPEMSDRTLYISAGADAMVLPLVKYLDEYEWNCTEQLTSRAMPYAVIGASEIAGISRDVSREKIAQTVAALKSRQNADGSFALWPGDARTDTRNNESDSDTANLTAYVINFLKIARNNGFTVPTDMIGRGVDYLRTYAASHIVDANSAAAHAFAIYVITANEYVTTAYINQFEEWANQNLRDWESRIMGAYIAAAYKIMHQDARADAIFARFRMSDNARFKYTSMFDNNVANDAIYMYLGRKYFANNAVSITPAASAYLASGNYSAYTSAMMIMGMAAPAGDATNLPDDAIVVNVGNTQIPVTIADGGASVKLPISSKKVTITCTTCTRRTPLNWTVITQGFPTDPRQTSDGMEITREYYNANGERITSARLGERITVKISVRARGDASYIPNAVIVDLFPGGFIADASTLTGDYEFYQSREDRMVIYAPISRDGTTFSYTAAASAAGTFAIPPAYGASMYNPSVTATENGGTFTVRNEM